MPQTHEREVGAKAEGNGQGDGHFPENFRQALGFTSSVCLLQTALLDKKEFTGQILAS